MSEIQIETVEAFEPVFSTERRYIRLQGGAGSGKSVFIAQYILLRIVEGQGERAYCFRKIGRTVLNSLYATFSDLISEYGLKEHFSSNKTDRTFTFLPSGNQIICSGMDDPEKVKSIKDPTIIWMEEATEFTYADFYQLDLRLRKLGADLKFLLSYNPISKANWLYTTFVKRADFNGDELFISSTYKDNPFLPQQYRDTLESLATRSPEHYQVYTLGNWGDITEGLIYRNWEIVDDDAFPDSPHVFGIDWGWNDPLVLVRTKLIDGALWVDEMFYRSETVLSVFISWLKAQDIAANDLIVCDTNPKENIEQLFYEGFKGAIPAKKGTIEGRINFLKTLKIKVTQRSTNLIEELNNYTWAKGKDGKFIDGRPIDLYNHAINAMEYAATLNVKPQHRSAKRGAIGGLTDSSPHTNMKFRRTILKRQS